MKRLLDTKLDDKIMMKCTKTAYSENTFTDDFDRISNFDDLKIRYQSLLIKHLDFWKISISDKFLVLYRLDISDCPTVAMSVKINQDLQVQIFPSINKFLESLLSPEGLLTHWSQVENILSYLESYEKSDNEKLDYYINQALDDLNTSLEIMTKKKSDSFSAEQKIRFLINQLHLLKFNEYSAQTIQFAYSIYLKSSSCYKEIQELGFLTLPSEKHLLKYILSDSQDETSDEDGY